MSSCAQCGKRLRREKVVNCLPNGEIRVVHPRCAVSIPLSQLPRDISVGRSYLYASPQERERRDAFAQSLQLQAKGHTP